MTSVIVNGVEHQLSSPPEMPLLWVLREELNLVGTKFGCGVAVCGACTVLIGPPGKRLAARSCVLPLSAVAGQSVTTIEGLSKAGDHPVQKAWIAHQVPQCGYCQSGMILATVALLDRHPQPTQQQAREAITNVCRCGTYPAMSRALDDLAGVRSAAQSSGAEGGKP